MVNKDLHEMSKYVVCVRVCVNACAHPYIQKSAFLVWNYFLNGLVFQDNT